MIRIFGPDMIELQNSENTTDEYVDKLWHHHCKICKIQLLHSLGDRFIEPYGFSGTGSLVAFLCSVIILQLFCLFHYRK